VQLGGSPGATTGRDLLAEVPRNTGDCVTDRHADEGRSRELPTADPGDMGISLVSSTVVC